MPRSEARAGAPDDALGALEAAIVEHTFALRPGYAVFLGRHEYDGRLPDLSVGGTDRWLATADRQLGELRALPASATTGERTLDRRLLELLLESPSFDLREARELERNPMAYLGVGSMTAYLVRDYAPAEQRAHAVLATLRAIPNVLAIGLDRLDERLPAPFLTLAESIGTGLSSHFDEVEAFTRAHAPALAAEVGAERARAQGAVDRFLTHLRDVWVPRSTPEFALGAERYQRLLWVREGIRTPFSEILAEGRRDLARNQARLAAIARDAPGGPSVDALLESLYRDHSSASELVPTAQRMVAETRAFLLEHQLASIPPGDHCRVEETPVYGRALSTASCNPPGPFDVGGDEGIYFITPVDAAWPAERQEQWLRSLNRPMLRNITVHEVYPGHYLQFLHHRQAAGSLARRVHISDSFTEGWAHYCEQLAVEEGLGAGTPAAEVAELHDALLRDCRLIASIGLHAGGMPVEDATMLFMREAHIERLPAEREAIRGTFNPEYYCYTLGKLAILRARERHLPTRFHGSLGRFHDRLLGFGAPPVGMIDALFEGGAA
jgi:uncharacterized protein (DUF885 family)